MNQTDLSLEQNANGQDTGDPSKFQIPTYKMTSDKIQFQKDSTSPAVYKFSVVMMSRVNEAVITSTARSERGRGESCLALGRGSFLSCEGAPLKKTEKPSLNDTIDFQQNPSKDRLKVCQLTSSEHVPMHNQLKLSERNREYNMEGKGKSLFDNCCDTKGPGQIKAGRSLLFGKNHEEQQQSQLMFGVKCEDGSEKYAAVSKEYKLKRENNCLLWQSASSQPSQLKDCKQKNQKLTTKQFKATYETLGNCSITFSCEKRQAQMINNSDKQKAFVHQKSKLRAGYRKIANRRAGVRLLDDQLSTEPSQIYVVSTMGCSSIETFTRGLQTEQQVGSLFTKKRTVSHPDSYYLSESSIGSPMLMPRRRTSNGSTTAAVARKNINLRQDDFYKFLLEELSPVMSSRSISYEIKIAKMKKTCEKEYNILSKEHSNIWGNSLAQQTNSLLSSTWHIIGNSVFEYIDSLLYAFPQDTANLSNLQSTLKRYSIDNFNFPRNYQRKQARVGAQMADFYIQPSIQKVSEIQPIQEIKRTISIQMEISLRPKCFEQVIQQIDKPMPWQTSSKKGIGVQKIKGQRINGQSLKNPRVSEFQNFTKLLMQRILKVFEKESINSLHLGEEIEEQLSRIIGRLKNLTKIGICKSDFTNHSHYRALFLQLTPASIKAVLALPSRGKDILNHKLLFNVDIQHASPADISCCNVLKRIVFNIFKRFSEISPDTSDQIARNPHPSRAKYLAFAKNGIAAMQKAHLITSFDLSSQNWQSEMDF